MKTLVWAIRSLLNSMGGVGSVGAWIRRWRGWREYIKFWRGSKKWRGWRGSKKWYESSFGGGQKLACIKKKNGLQKKVLLFNHTLYETLCLLWNLI